MTTFHPTMQLKIQNAMSSLGDHALVALLKGIVIYEEGEGFGLASWGVHLAAIRV
jgi:hypothetical protein